MKRILLAICFSFIYCFGFSQFSTIQNLGAPQTLVDARGGFKADSALILPSFPDTTTANRSQFIKFYAGNTIRVADTVYIRNSTATKWINIGGGGAGYTTTSKLNDSSYRLIRPDNTADTFVYTSASSSAIDTTSLSDRINLKLNISDTSSMLLPYLRKVDTASLSSRINLKVNISDTATMLNKYLRKTDTASLSNRINLKLNISDTSSMLLPYLRKVDTTSKWVNNITRTPGKDSIIFFIGGTRYAIKDSTGGGGVTSVAAGYGLSGGTITSTGTLAVDSSSLSSKYLRLVDTSTMLSPYSKLKSVGVSMPSAFTVTNSPLTSNGTIAVTGAGAATQYIRGDGVLADFPSSTGGGSSVSYYLNGSVSQGTIGGVAYKEINTVPIIGTGTDFSINADGYIAQFITDTSDPNKLLIPAGNWNFETYFSASSSGGTPSFYIELYKYNGTTFTLIASNSATPELITGGTSIDLYFTALAVPSTTLLATDRLAVRFYVTHSGRTITMHTENSHLSQIITTFSTGLNDLNGLTAQTQYFATGTSGSDFNISSASATHTFNLPTASATNRGALSSANWSTFNGKIGAGDTATMLLPYLRKVDTTAMLLPYLRKVDTTAMLTPYSRKLAAAYTMNANNTNAAASEATQTFRDSAQKAYTGSIAWTGTTAPSGATNHSYRWFQVGKLVTLRITLIYATAGAALTSVTCALPSDCPAPEIVSGSTANSSYLYEGSGTLSTAVTSAGISATINGGISELRINSGGTGYEIFIARFAAGYATARATIQYFAQ